MPDMAVTPQRQRSRINEWHIQEMHPLHISRTRQALSVMARLLHGTSRFPRVRPDGDGVGSTILRIEHLDCAVELYDICGARHKATHRKRMRDPVSQAAHGACEMRYMCYVHVWRLDTHKGLTSRNKPRLPRLSTTQPGTAVHRLLRTISTYCTLYYVLQCTTCCVVLAMPYGVSLCCIGTTFDNIMTCVCVCGCLSACV